ncbi:unnamed protein product [Ectocarpus sp. CCAP 1310/34]|nr:unnamed protein product [Ectocarpus sp. CCAP 1310/34]
MGSDSKRCPGCGLHTHAHCRRKRREASPGAAGATGGAGAGAGDGSWACDECKRREDGVAVASADDPVWLRLKAARLDGGFKVSSPSPLQPYSTAAAAAAVPAAAPAAAAAAASRGSSSCVVMQAFSSLGSATAPAPAAAAAAAAAFRPASRPPHSPAMPEAAAGAAAAPAVTTAGDAAQDGDGDRKANSGNEDDEAFSAHFARSSRKTNGGGEGTGSKGGHSQTKASSTPAPTPVRRRRGDAEARTAVAALARIKKNKSEEQEEEKLCETPDDVIALAGGTTRGSRQGPRQGSGGAGGGDDAKAERLENGAGQAPDASALVSGGGGAREDDAGVSADADDEREETEVIESKVTGVTVEDGDQCGGGRGGGDDGSGGSGKGGQAGLKKPRGSEDAYMLIYVKRGVAWGPSSAERDAEKLPEDVLAAVKASNEALLANVDRYDREKLLLDRHMQDRRELYARIFGPPLKPAPPAGRKGKGKGPAQAIVINEENNGGFGEEEEEEDEEEEEEEEEADKADDGKGQEEPGNGPAAKRARRRSRADSCTADEGTTGAAAGGGDEDVGVVPYVHPSPSDEELEESDATAGGDDDEARQAAAVSAIAAAAAKADESTTQEELDYAQAVAASLAQSPTAAAAAADSEEDEGQEEPPGNIPESKFFWVETEWLRQWIVGQHADQDGESAAAAAAAAAAASTAISLPSKGGSSGGDPLVLDGVAASEGGEARGGGGDGGSEMMEVEETTKAAGEGEASDGAGAADAGDEPEARECDGAAVAAHSSRGDPEEEATGGPVPRGEEEEEEGAPEQEGNPGSDENSGCLGHDADGVEGDVARTTCPVATCDNNGNLEVYSQGEEVLLTEEVEEETPCVFTKRLSNLPLLCPHGGLHPASVSKFKLVTRAAYEGILSTVCMPLPDYHLSASNYYCSLCVKDHIGQKESNVNVSRESGELLAELEKPEPSWPPPQQQQREGTRTARGRGGGRGEGASPQVPFAISRKWVADLKVCHDQFLRNAGKSPSNSQGSGGKGKVRGGGKGRGRGGQGGGAGGEPVGAMRLPDGRVNQNITCEHGNLVGGRKYRWISPRGWEMVKSLFPLAQEVEYPAGTQPCSQCEEQVVGATTKEQDKDEMKLKRGLRQAKSAELVTGKRTAKLAAGPEEVERYLGSCWCFVSGGVQHCPVVGGAGLCVWLALQGEQRGDGSRKECLVSGPAR